MDRVLTCDCGFEARSEREDFLVAEVVRHAWEAHGMALSHDDAVLLAGRAQPADGLRPTRPRHSATRTDEEER